MKNKTSYKSYLSRHAETPKCCHAETPKGRHVEFMSASRCYNNQTLKPILQTPDYNLPGRGQAEKAAVQGDVQGFTLIELLVVVLIIGILASIAVPQYQKAVDKAEMAGVLATFSSIRQSMERYRLANGSWPASLDDLDITIPPSKWIFILTPTTGTESCAWPSPNGQPRGWASIRADRGNISGTGYGAVFYSIPGRSAYSFNPGVFCCVAGTGKNMERIKRMCNAIKEPDGDAGSCYTGSKISVRLDK